MSTINAFCVVEQDFVQTYKFSDKWITCYDNPQNAREELEEFSDDETNFRGYIAEVAIEGNLFNIFDLAHRKILFNALPSKLNHNGYITPKEIYMLHLMGMWNKDSAEIQNIFALEDTEKFFYNEIMLDFVEDYGYCGYVAKYENFSVYVVLNPNSNLSVINISL